jgi:release factor glutamine methyltransferase
MTIRERYLQFISELSILYGKGEAEAITKIIFEHFLEIDRSFIIRNPESTLSPDKEVLLTIALQDLLHHVPVQYVTGIADFYGLRFKVSPHVLIPRPETEELVQCALTLLEQHPVGTILDVGTGSGCIPVSIKKNNPSVSITAIDVDLKALEIAQENAIVNQTDIEFKKMDFLNKAERENLGHFDLIISNPPYIPVSEMETMDKNVTSFEPHHALFVDDNRPLIFYEAILDFSEMHLNPKGIILLETHEELSFEVADLFRNLYQDVEVKKDLYGKNRMVVAAKGI